MGNGVLVAWIRVMLISPVNLKLMIPSDSNMTLILTPDTDDIAIT